MLRRVILSGAVVAALLPVASASAATTYTVDSAAPAGCANNVCKTLTDAAAKVADGDVIMLKPGLYTEAAPVVISKAKVAVTASPNTAVLSVAAGAGKAMPVLTLAGSGDSLDGLIVTSAAGQGAALALTSSSTVTRATLSSVAEPAASALTVTNPETSSTALSTRLDSVVLAAGKSAPGLAVTTAANPLMQSGDATITGTHVTIAGGNKPVAIEAQAGGTAAAGDIAVTLDRSIVHGSGKSTATAAATTPILGGPPAKVALTVKNSDATDVTAAPITVSGGQKSADTALFADAAKGNYRLRVGSPAIDKGGAQVSGESTTDVDGQPRVVGTASDLGADEFVNVAPTAALAVAPLSVTPGQAVTFDASTSVDPDAGGAVANYLISFGDGTGVYQPTPVATHAYTKPGVYTARLLETDNSGTPSNTVTATITVRDVKPPALTILGPKAGKVFSRLTKAKKVRRIAIFGVVSDDAAVAKVEVSIKRVSLAKVKKKTTTTKKKAKKSASSCVFLTDGKDTFGKRACSKPAYFLVNQVKGGYVYQTKSSTKYKAGTYAVTVRATDTSGLVATTQPVKFVLK